jgi:hypothetical protein
LMIGRQVLNDRVAQVCVHHCAVSITHRACMAWGGWQASPCCGHQVAVGVGVAACVQVLQPSLLSEHAVTSCIGLYRDCILQKQQSGAIHHLRATQRNAGCLFSALQCLQLLGCSDAASR